MRMVGVAQRVCWSKNNRSHNLSMCTPGCSGARHPVQVDPPPAGGPLGRPQDVQNLSNHSSSVGSVSDTRPVLNQSTSYDNNADD